MAQYLLHDNPTIISFYTLASSFHLTINIAQQIKEQSKDTKIILGGPHATLLSEEILTSDYGKYIDLISIDEGEYNIVKIIDHFYNFVDINKLSGIAYIRNGTYFIKKSKELVNLETLPIIEFPSELLKKVKEVPIEVGRGCPFECIFCSTSHFWKKKFRLKSINKIISEIIYYSNFGFSTFNFIHDLFTLDKVFIIKFCTELIKNNLNIKWGCSARLDTLDERLIKLMNEAGCTGIYIGLETYSQSLQSKIKKNLTLKNCEHIFSTLLYFNIDTTVSFIYGFPEETEKDLIMTLNFIENLKFKNKFTTTQLHLCSFLPKTELTTQFFNTLSFPIKTSILEGIHIKDYQEEINSKKIIYSQFYSINTQILSKYLHLDIFLNFFYNFLIENYYYSLKYLKLYKNIHILNIYNFMKNHLILTEYFIFNLFTSKINSFEFKKYLRLIIFKYFFKKILDPIFQDICKYDDNIFIAIQYKMTITDSFSTNISAFITENKIIQNHQEVFTDFIPLKENEIKIETFIFEESD